MTNSYWDRVSARRISRRRVLGYGAAGAAAAAFLAACGGGDDTSSSSGGSAGSGSKADLVTKPQDTFKQAVRGGVLKDYTNAEPQTLDPATPVSPLNPIARYVYGTLVTEKPGHLEPPDGTLQGDFAESWEVSPDRLQITFKMRPGIKWHNKAPVNGREADIDDVMVAWKRYITLSPFGDLAYNGKNPDAPILSFEATDATTLVAKLKEPLSYAINYFAGYGSHSGNIIMVPKEADGGVDLRHEMIGHGPFYLEQSTPSVGYTFKRHEGYYNQDWALVDQVDVPIVPEYAARLSQLKVGNIHRLYGSDPLGEDVAIIKQDEPRLSLYATDRSTPTKDVLIFGLLPEGKSPFVDQRVRQAFSMAIDRDAWIDALYNVSGFEKAGLPSESRWNSHLLSIWQNPAYWLDPKGSEFGANAKYFQFNPEDAKKLLDAAGYGDLSTTSSYTVERRNVAPVAEPIDGMLRNIGIKITVNTPDYATQYIPDYRDAQGQFEGYAYATVTGTMPQLLHPASAIAAEYWPQGGTAFRGFSKSGANDKSGDPELNAMIEKARLEFDPAALKQQLYDIQRHLAEAMWGLNMPGGGTRYTFSWPAVQGTEVWRPQPGTVNSIWDTYQLWLDKTRAPFA